VGWLFRVIAVVGGFTFIAGGIDVATAEQCGSVSFGGSRRNATYTCFAGDQGEIPAGLASTGMIAFGLIMILAGVWPLPKLLYRSYQIRREDERERLRSGLSPAEWRAQQEAQAEAMIRLILGTSQTASASEPPSIAVGQGELPPPQPGSWRADPTGRYEQRNWNGVEWTAEVRVGDRVLQDPPN